MTKQTRYKSKDMRFLPENDNEPLDEFIRVRVTKREKSEFVARSEQEGLTISGYGRQLFFPGTLPRKGSKRPHPDKKLFSLTLRNLGPVSSNLNQLTKKANMGEWPNRKDIRDCLDELRQFYKDLYAAFGLKR